VAKHQDWRTHFNSVLICIFANVSPQTQVDLINAQLRLEVDHPRLMKSGERAWNLKRAINNRMGLNADNDKLPKALLEPLPEGGSAGYSPDMEGMLFAYYEARGWDLETGKPTKENCWSWAWTISQRICGSRGGVPLYNDCVRVFCKKCDLLFTNTSSITRGRILWQQKY
jgi:hypothetical protein